MPDFPPQLVKPPSLSTHSFHPLTKPSLPQHPPCLHSLLPQYSASTSVLWLPPLPTYQPSLPTAASPSSPAHPLTAPSAISSLSALLSSRPPFPSTIKTKPTTS